MTQTTCTVMAPAEGTTDHITAFPSAMQIIDDLTRATPEIVAFAAFEIDGFATLAGELSARELVDLMRDVALLLHRCVPSGILLARGHNSPFLAATVNRGERSASRFALRALREVMSDFLPSGHAISLSAGVATATDCSMLGLRSAICMAECQAKRARATGGGALMLDSGTRCVPATFASFTPAEDCGATESAWAS